MCAWLLRSHQCRDSRARLIRLPRDCYTEWHNHEDTRKDYGEHRFRVLGFIDERLYAIVFTPRAGKVHVISLRKANFREVTRHAKTPQA